jgi:LPXTG-motif cell wall-anchored protein
MKKKTLLAVGAVAGLGYLLYRGSRGMAGLGLEVTGQTPEQVKAATDAALASAIGSARQSRANEAAAAGSNKWLYMIAGGAALVGLGYWYLRRRSRAAAAPAGV